MKIMNLLEVISENWSVIIALLALVIVVAVAIYKFYKLPNSEQVKKIKKCLLGWVIQAEKDLGSGTGKVKLSVVYGTFVTTFPIIKNFISFETFSDWVDDSLEEMRKMLKENEKLKAKVEGELLESVTAEVITKE